MHANKSKFCHKLPVKLFPQQLVLFGQLKGPESSVLCVSNLVGGVYLFELTVSDSLGQTGRTGVIVDVVEGGQSLHATI